MNNRFSAFAPRLALGLVLSSALGSAIWLWWSTVRSRDINFLPRISPAEWVVYPCPPQGGTHPKLELGTVFRSGFLLDKPPTQGSLRVAGFHRYTVSINGQPVEGPLRQGRNWKEPDRFE